MKSINKDFSFLEEYKKLREEQGFKPLNESEEKDYIKTVKKINQLEKLFNN